MSRSMPLRAATSALHKVMSFGCATTFEAHAAQHRCMHPKVMWVMVWTVHTANRLAPCSVGKQAGAQLVSVQLGDCLGEC